jgi:hypothetical protein
MAMTMAFCRADRLLGGAISVYSSALLVTDRSSGEVACDGTRFRLNAMTIVTGGFRGRTLVRQRVLGATCLLRGLPPRGTQSAMAENVGT